MTIISNGKRTMGLERRLREIPQNKYHVLAQLKGWSLAYAQGHVEGESARMNKMAPTIYAVVGIDDYCLGYRDAYFANERRSPNANADLKDTMDSRNAITARSDTP